MNEVFKAWNKMRLKYQYRYARQYKRAVQYLNSKNDYVLCEMSFVLINVFGLTSKQILEIEKNGGMTNDDLLREDV